MSCMCMSDSAVFISEKVYICSRDKGYLVYPKKKKTYGEKIEESMSFNYHYMKKRLIKTLVFLRFCCLSVETFYFLSTSLNHIQ